MLKEFEGQMPKIDKKAHAFESADLIGKVEMKEYSSAWFNVTIRGDVNRIEVGRYSNIQDNCCLHVADDYAPALLVILLLSVMVLSCTPVLWKIIA